MATVSVDTATIRVSRTTRDLLATQARERGLSLAALLAEVARERELEAIWRSERDASRSDALRTEVAEDDRTWETALGDGLD
jgi:hypothetical protein